MNHGVGTKFFKHMMYIQKKISLLVGIFSTLANKHNDYR